MLECSHLCRIKPNWDASRRWDKPLIIYGDAALDKNHPVVAFLAKEKRAKSVSLYKPGYASGVPDTALLSTDLHCTNTISHLEG